MAFCADCGTKTCRDAKRCRSCTDVHLHGTLSDRFWARVDKRGPDECWLWTGRRNKSGYGQTRDGRLLRSVHRISWELHKGPLPKGDGSHGTCVLHHCDVRNCVNPAHLFIGTHKDNMLDAARKGRMGVGDQRGEKNNGAKLTANDVRNIRAIYSNGGISQRALAMDFGITQANISEIVSWKIWKDDGPRERQSRGT